MIGSDLQGFAAAGEQYGVVATEAAQVLSELNERRSALETLVQQSIEAIDALKAQHSASEGDAWKDVEAARIDCEEFQKTGFSVDGQLTAEAVKGQAERAQKLVSALDTLHEQLAAHQQLRSAHERTLGGQLEQRVRKLENAELRVQESAQRLQNTVGGLVAADSSEETASKSQLADYAPVVLKVAAVLATVYAVSRLVS